VRMSRLTASHVAMTAARTSHFMVFWTRLLLTKAFVFELKCHNVDGIDFYSWIAGFQANPPVSRRPNRWYTSRAGQRRFRSYQLHPLPRPSASVRVQRSG
jgi:hypothetical protein